MEGKKQDIAHALKAINGFVEFSCLASPTMVPKTDEPRYCNKNATNPRATIFTYHPEVRTNLEVTMLYILVEVRVLPLVIAHLARDPSGSKPNFYRVRRSLILMEGEKT